MGKPILWSADRIQTNENNRFATDIQIENWNNKLENITIDNWNEAVESGFYSALAGATNAPDASVALSGTVITSGNLIIQQLYPEDTSTEELIYYIRKGFKSNNNITWSKWFITNLYMEEYIEPYNLTPIIKGCDDISNLFKQLIPDTATSIYFTDIKMPSDATLIDVDEDGDGGVVAWLDTSDNTKMYVSTQYKGVKVESNTNSDSVFYGCGNLTSLDLSNFDTSKITSMTYMFYKCSSLTTLNISNFNTNNVTDMSRMFSGCSSLSSLDLSKFNTSNVTKMSDMFYSCNSLSSLDLSNWDTSNVTSMTYMFNNCSKLTTLDLSSFNTSNVSNMYDMFYNCSKLTSLDLSKFNTSNVTKMSYMFNGCNKLTKLDLSSFDTSKVTSMNSMFDGCSKLTTIKVGNKFKWIPTLNKLGLVGTWQDETGNTYTSTDTFPSNIAHTYTKVS